MDRHPTITHELANARQWAALAAASSAHRLPPRPLRESVAGALRRVADRLDRASVRGEPVTHGRSDICITPA